MLKNILANLKSKPSSPVKDGRISYKFKCGLEAHQEELDVYQDEELIQAISNFDLKNIVEGSAVIKDIINLLLKEDSLNKVLNIIFKTKDVNYKLLKNSELHSVFSDFFSLNPTAVNWLKTIGGDPTFAKMIRSMSGSGKIPGENN